MTLIGYLTRTHFAEAAIEDALPEEVGPLARALALIDDEPASAAVCTRVQESLDQTTISIARVGQATLPADATSRILDALRDVRTNTLIAVCFGGLIPLALSAIRQDPALASGPILTTVTDMSGFFIVLKLASMVLPLLTT